MYSLFRSTGVTNSHDRKISATTAGRFGNNISSRAATRTVLNTTISSPEKVKE